MYAHLPGCVISIKVEQFDAIRMLGTTDMERQRRVASKNLLQHIYRSL